MQTLATKGRATIIMVGNHTMATALPITVRNTVEIRTALRWHSGNFLCTVTRIRGVATKNGLVGNLAATQFIKLARYSAHSVYSVFTLLSSDRQQFSQCIIAGIQLLASQARRLRQNYWLALPAIPLATLRSVHVRCTCLIRKTAHNTCAHTLNLVPSHLSRAV